MYEIYKSKNINMKLISKKYAYYLGVYMGMKKDWLGRDMEECH